MSARHGKPQTMTIRVEATITVDAERAHLWALTHGEQGREGYLRLFAADLSEAPALVETGARLMWHRLGGKVPEPVELAALNGRTVRDQVRFDRDAAFF
ncbi:hypothetical protein HNR23_002218 [Nocardiopsis mwathae]|uniref:Uncharacterized protein n=1 Tax=Nocardiopsis mwathae TaxID=1472723 RepID=A0A7X0D5E2_9ACTN|nr:hypothetical protein [Nocardiopsis mwathae]MBB6172158.1 hypothetical protein [Nocardiopsis mwathae]